MDKAFLERMRQRLLAQRDEILERIGVDRDEYLAVVESSRTGDLADSAEAEVDGDTLATLGIQERDHLSRISSALFRLEQDSYGICESCGGRIPQQRLEAAPDAVLCVECRRRARTEVGQGPPQTRRVGLSRASASRFSPCAAGGCCRSRSLPGSERFPLRWFLPADCGAAR
jgi:DnaK suppressor protein